MYCFSQTNKLIGIREDNELKGDYYPLTRLQHTFM